MILGPYCYQLIQKIMKKPVNSECYGLLYLNVPVFSGEGGIAALRGGDPGVGGLRLFIAPSDGLWPSSFFVFRIRCEQARASASNKKPAAEAAGAMKSLAEREGFEPPEV